MQVVQLCVLSFVAKYEALVCIVIACLQGSSLSIIMQFIEGKIKGGIEVTGRRGRRRRKLLDDLKERTGYSHLNDEALDCTINNWCIFFGFPLIH
jgi:hypothetical protein